MTAMEQLPIDPSSSTSVVTGPASAPVSEALSPLSRLLGSNETLPLRTRTPREQAAETHQNQLVQARLGIASGLFHALRAKHGPTAAHSLRVAVNCSAWGMARAMCESELDELEVAALLHDIGKIGVPDLVLQKPGRLMGEELTLMERHRHFGQAILRSCCASTEVLGIVGYTNAWFDGTREGFDRHGVELPLGARMLSIVDAFDAMTTDHPYRRAMSRERAITELFEFAGRQFDPELVRDFSQCFSVEPGHLQAKVVRRWLQQLSNEMRTRHWQQTGIEGGLPEFDLSQAYHAKLLDSMQDGVAFIDARGQILFWNLACERLTGITAAAVQQRIWEPDLVSLRDDRNHRITPEEDPVGVAIQSGTQVLRRMAISARNGNDLAVNVHVMPVFGEDGVAQGATLLLHDATSQSTLEERVQTLYERATQDPLTKVANRAEFNRLHEVFVEEHLRHGLTCALIICDLDHFKRINDQYGHPAGDAALISFAALLQRNCRQGDLVARYGGEEFVMLCADCDNGAATARAEDIRRQLAATPQPAIAGQPITASFGVTELQPGDNPDTMLRRADRALLQAKAEGRNTVVQLGAGMSHEQFQDAEKKGWLHRLANSGESHVIKRTLMSVVPVNITVEKLRGFIADHNAQLLSVEDNLVVMRIEGSVQQAKRANDRPVPFFVEIRLQEEIHVPPRGGASTPRTLMFVTIRPKRHRDRRLSDLDERMRRLVFSIRSYLMATELEGSQQIVTRDESSPGMFDRFCATLDHWFGRRS